MAKGDHDEVENMIGSQGQTAQNYQNQIQGQQAGMYSNIGSNVSNPFSPYYQPSYGTGLPPGYMYDPYGIPQAPNMFNGGYQAQFGMPTFANTGGPVNTFAGSGLANMYSGATQAGPTSYSMPGGQQGGQQGMGMPSGNIMQEIQAYQQANPGVPNVQGLYQHLLGLGYQVEIPTHAGGTQMSKDKLVLPGGAVYDFAFNEGSPGSYWTMNPDGYWVGGRPSQTPGYYTAPDPEPGGFGGFGGGGGGMFPGYGGATPYLFGGMNFDPFAMQGMSGALSGYGNFAQTGGFSEKDLQNIRARAVAPTKRIYELGQAELQRAKNLSGGYMPNFGAAQSRMARQQGYAVGDIAQNTEGMIAEAIRSGKLAGLQGMAGIGTAAGQMGLQKQLGLGNLGLGYAGLGNQMTLGMGQLGLGYGQLGLGYHNAGINRELGLGNIGLGYTNAGNVRDLGMGQLGLGAGQLGLGLANSQNNLNLGLIDARIRGAGVPSDFDQGMARAGQIGNIAGNVILPFM